MVEDGRAAARRRRRQAADLVQARGGWMDGWQYARKDGGLSEICGPLRCVALRAGSGCVRVQADAGWRADVLLLLDGTVCPSRRGRPWRSDSAVSGKKEERTTTATKPAIRGDQCTGGGAETRLPRVSVAP